MQILKAIFIFFFDLMAPDRLLSTAPKHLKDRDTAAEHLLFASIAASEYGIAREMVLSIAWNESHYQANNITAEPNGLYSCGVMTPIPRPNKCVPGDLLQGYREGTAHLRTWMDTPYCRGNLRCGILGYVGGGALISACAKGPHMVKRGNREFDLCQAVIATRFGRANIIKKALSGKPNS